MLVGVMSMYTTGRCLQLMLINTVMEHEGQYYLLNCNCPVFDSHIALDAHVSRGVPIAGADPGSFKSEEGGGGCPRPPCAGVLH